MTDVKHPLRECPVIIILGCGEHKVPFESRSDIYCPEHIDGKEDCWEEYARCESPVEISVWQDLESSGKLYISSGCWQGHTLVEMQRDINLDLDGIPISG